MIKIFPLILVFLIGFIFLLVVFFLAIFRIKTSKLPYLKKDSLLTEAEKRFYFVLTEIIRNDYLIFSKVRMADLLYLPKMSNSDFYHYQNKIQSKHVDFLICNKENTKPMLAIELDDSSHSKIDRILRDTLVNRIFESAKLPILHIKTSGNYDKEKLLNQVKNLTEIKY